jgi:hypothetical protein
MIRSVNQARKGTAAAAWRNIRTGIVTDAYRNSNIAVSKAHLI